MTKEQVQKVFIFGLVFGGAFLVLRAFMPKSRKSTAVGKIEMSEHDVEERQYVTPPPPIDPAQAQSNPKAAEAHLALSVYIDAMNSGVSNAELEKVNAELTNDIGLKVYRRRTDNKIVVKDLNGVDVIEYDATAAANA